MRTGVIEEHNKVWCGLAQQCMLQRSTHFSGFPDAQINQHFDNFVFVPPMQLKSVKPIELFKTMLEA
jgi:hypothetical protein